MKTLCLDFDGVIHSYVTPWQSADVIPDRPVLGAMAFLAEAVRHFDVAIYSSRSNQEGGIPAMRDWLWKWLHEDLGTAGYEFDAVQEVFEAISWPVVKPPAHVTLDDRALTFKGSWPEMGELISFKPWNK